MSSTRFRNNFDFCPVKVGFFAGHLDNEVADSLRQTVPTHLGLLKGRESLVQKIELPDAECITHLFDVRGIPDEFKDALLEDRVLVPCEFASAVPQRARVKNAAKEALIVDIDDSGNKVFLTYVLDGHDLGSFFATIDA